MVRRGTAAVCLLLLLAVGGAALAEVSADRSGDRRVTTLLMDLRNDPNGMTDGSDPIPNVGWNQYRRLPERRVLNRTGALRHDGRPDVGFFPHVFTPVVVWAYNGQSDHDIAIAEWTADGWSPTRFLTNNADLDEVDPRVFVDRTAGLHLVWAVAGEDPHIVYQRGQGIDGWRPPIRVTPPGQVVHRPSVATIGGVLVVAYEQEFSLDGNAARAIVVRRLNGGNEDGDVGNFVQSRAFPVPRHEDLQPILHVRGGQLWLDWKHTEGHLGWTVFQDQEWTDVRLFPWIDPSWVGVENAREGIEYLLLSPKLPDPWE